MRKQIGYIGLGKMGSAMVARLRKEGWEVVSYDVNGRGTAKTAEQLVVSLAKPRVVWIMVPAGRPVDDVAGELSKCLERGDVVVDGGNSLFERSQKRAKDMRQRGVYYVDVGVSGGPGTVRAGKPALMIGGERKIFQRLEPLFRAVTQRESYGYMGASGAGHFVKMVHNGIEYGMMQSLAEGFTIMERTPLKLNLREVARVYNNGSVIQSRLTGWLQEGYKKYGEELQKAAGSVEHTGEGEWTVKTARKLKVPVPVIEASFRFRTRSKAMPSYTGKVVMLLRHMFGGHDLNPKKT